MVETDGSEGWGKKSIWTKQRLRTVRTSVLHNAWLVLEESPGFIIFCALHTHF